MPQSITIWKIRLRISPEAYCAVHYLTRTMQVSCFPSTVAVTLVVPTPMPVTFPPLTVATPESATAQLTEALVPLTFSV
jgi:hypothetical protein